MMPASGGVVGVACSLLDIAVMGSIPGGGIDLSSSVSANPILDVGPSLSSLSSTSLISSCAACWLVTILSPSFYFLLILNSKAGYTNLTNCLSVSSNPLNWSHGTGVNLVLLASRGGKKTF